VSLRLAISLSVLVILGAPVAAQGFDHAKHRKVFAACTSCHRGVSEPGAAMYPDSASCASCHDGTVEKRVTWVPHAGPRHSNLRFSHERHVVAVAGHGEAPGCATCHAAAGAGWMNVGAATPERCLDCHRIRTAHLAAPDSACTVCHLPLAQAVALTTADVRTFPVPPSHRDPGFPGRLGHGALAQRPAASCATCHARDFCLQCHVDQPARPAIAALAPDPRSLAITARRPPASHGANFADRHAAPAAATAATCAGCHVRADCLDCHRPQAAAAPGYHPAGFLARHPAAAYARETSCSDCHNVGSFCATCHVAAGLVAKTTLRGGYHDARQFFVAGHGRAARQSLETCVGCHVERDCLTCHSAVGGRHINPHGPGFDAARMRRKNPEVCTACHGVVIPP